MEKRIVQTNTNEIFLPGPIEFTAGTNLTIVQKGAVVIEATNSDPITSGQYDPAGITIDAGASVTFKNLSIYSSLNANQGMSGADGEDGADGGGSGTNGSVGTPGVRVSTIDNKGTLTLVDTQIKGGGSVNGTPGGGGNGGNGGSGGDGTDPGGVGGSGGISAQGSAGGAVVGGITNEQGATLVLKDLAVIDSVATGGSGGNGGDGGSGGNGGDASNTVLQGVGGAGGSGGNGGDGGTGVGGIENLGNIKVVGAAIAVDNNGLPGNGGEAGGLGGATGCRTATSTCRRAIAWRRPAFSSPSTS